VLPQATATYFWLSSHNLGFGLHISNPSYGPFSREVGAIFRQPSLIDINIAIGDESPRPQYSWKTSGGKEIRHSEDACGHVKQVLKQRIKALSTHGLGEDIRHGRMVDSCLSAAGGRYSGTQVLLDL